MHAGDEVEEENIASKKVDGCSDELKEAVAHEELEEKVTAVVEGEGEVKAELGADIEELEEKEGRKGKEWGRVATSSEAEHVTELSASVFFGRPLFLDFSIFFFSSFASISLLTVANRL